MGIGSKILRRVTSVQTTRSGGKVHVRASDGARVGREYRDTGSGKLPYRVGRGCGERYLSEGAAAAAAKGK